VSARPPPAAAAPAIRRAGPDDLGDVARLWAALAAHHAALDPHFRLRDDAAPALRELLRAQLRDPDVLALLAVDAAGDAVGLLLARVDAAPPVLRECARAEILDLWVEPAGRGRGHGRALARAALAWIAERGATRTEVRVAARNDAGRAFWRALGFAPFVDVLDLRR